MRVWTEELFPKLCYIHSFRSFNEGSTIYDIVACDKVKVDGKEYRAICNSCGTINPGHAKCPKCGKRLDGYFYHPAVREWWFWPVSLHLQLELLYKQCIKRLKVEQGQEPNRSFTLPHSVPWIPSAPKNKHSIADRIPWQTYDQQLEVLRHKRSTQTNCRCSV